MAVLAPPVQVVASGAPPFVQVPSGAPPFVVTTGPAPPIMIVASGAPPITLFNADGSLWAGGGGAAVGGAALLTGETDGFATDFTYATDASRVALKAANVTTSYAVDAFYTQSGTSPKMVYNASGVLVWSPHNLLASSNDFATNWDIGAGLTKAKNATGPLGANTATTLTMTAGTGSKWLYCNGPPSGNYRYSVYAKAGTLSWFSLGDGSGSTAHAAFFNVSAGTVGTVAGRASSALIESVGSGWYRCSCIFTGAVGFMAIQPTNADNTGISWAATGGETLLISAAQAENPSATLNPYLDGGVFSARVGLALDYDPVTHAARGLLCEPQATNTAKQSETFTDAAVWNTVGSVTVTAAATTAPNGLSTATKMANATTTTGQHQLLYNLVIPVTNGQPYTVSLYAKAAEWSWIGVEEDLLNTHKTYFNLATGALGTVNAAHTGATITSVGNGWYRCTFSYVASGTQVSPNIYLQTADGQGAVAGVVGAGVYIWGFQFEAGTVATSYIPTLAATVTRAADQVNVTPASINYSATAGSWWADINALNTGSGLRVIGYTTGQYTPISADAAGFTLYDGFVVTRSIGSGLGAHKAAAAFASSDRAITADGLAVVANASAGIELLSPGATIGVGYNSGGASAYFSGYIRQLRYLPRRPTNAELQTMTQPSDGLAPYLGQVATRSTIVSSGGINPGINFGASARSAHWARDTVSALQLVFWNGYVATATGIETGTGASMQIKASIEYPAGTFTQVKFAGIATGTVASNALIVSDLTTIVIPNGDQFWVRTYQLCANGALFFDQKANSAIGDRLAFDGTDKTMSGTIADSNPGYTWTPAAIVATTTRRSALVVGTSRTFGSGDTADSSGDMGSVCRSIGPVRGYINSGIPSNKASQLKTNNAVRVALSAYVSDVFIDHGVNDSQATIQADEALCFALFPGKRIHAMTQSPHTTGAWSVANGSDQTVATDMSAHKAWLLTKPGGISYAWDVNAVTSLAANEDKWRAGYTTDGIHEAATGDQAIKATLGPFIAVALGE